MFTRNQIEEIRRKLQISGKRDTDFPIAGPIIGDEIVAFVQSGRNVQMTMKDFIEKVLYCHKSDFINVSKYLDTPIDIKEAIELVEPINRRGGLVITFLDKDTGNWSIYQFNDSNPNNWYNSDSWINILEGNNISDLSYANKWDAIYSKDFSNFEPKLDDTYADRATKDALGKVIHENYVSREEMINYVREVLSKAGIVV